MIVELLSRKPSAVEQRNFQDPLDDFFERYTMLAIHARPGPASPLLQMVCFKASRCLLIAALHHVACPPRPSLSCCSATCTLSTTLPRKTLSQACFNDNQSKILSMELDIPEFGIQTTLIASFVGLNKLRARRRQTSVFVTNVAQSRVAVILGRAITVQSLSRAESHTSSISADLAVVATPSRSQMKITCSGDGSD